MQSVKFELVINVSTDKMLGLDAKLHIALSSLSPRGNPLST
jgi:hypothetical protein